MKVLCLVLLIAIFGCCQGKNVQPVAININAVVDAALNSLRPVMKSSGMDPASLPTLSASFSKKIGFIKVKGSASIKNGKLNNLSTIRRNGDCTFNSVGTEVIADCNLVFNNLNGKYNINAKFSGVSVSATASATASSFKIYIKIGQQLPGKASLKSYSQSAGSVSVNISGLGALGWTLNSIAKVITPKVKDRIISELQSPVKNALANEISKINIAA